MNTNKHKLLILCVFCALCGSVYGANEIRAFNAGATTCFSVVRNVSGQVWYPVGSVFEAWGTAGRTAADYDIALTNKTGGMFVGTMDTNIAAGFYTIVSYQQVGAGPADTDPATWQEYGYWSGTTWTAAPIMAATIADTVWDEATADHTGETTFGGELGTLDPNITLILEDTGTTIPGLIAALPVASGIADAVWDDLIASHTAEASFGGELQQLDPNLTFVLADTSAYDTDAEHAAAIWNALMATYTLEASFGGELQQLDPNITLIKAITDILPAITTTVASATDPNTFVLTAGLAVADVYNGMTIYLKDLTDNHWESRLIVDWAANRTVDVDSNFGFTPAATDLAYIWGPTYFPVGVYDGLPLPPTGDTITIDNRAAVGAGGTTGGTRTLDIEGDDPP